MRYFIAMREVEFNYSQYLKISWAGCVVGIVDV